MNWFKAITLSALCLMAFSVFYYYMIFLPKLETARVDREAREKAKQEEEDKAKEAAVEKVAKESIEDREKAKRELEQAQAEFERQVREDQAKEKERQEQEKIKQQALARKAQAESCIVRVRNRPQPTDLFDQLLSSYAMALCSRLGREEITKERFDYLLVQMATGIQLEKQKLAREQYRQRLEQERLILEWQQRQQAVQALQGAAEAQRQAALAQQRAAEAQHLAIAQQRAFQQYWANWAQNFQQRMQDPVRCNGMSLGSGRFTVNCQ